MCGYHSVSHSCLNFGFCYSFVKRPSLLANLSPLPPGIHRIPEILLEGSDVWATIDEAEDLEEIQSVLQTFVFSVMMQRINHVLMEVSGGLVGGALFVLSRFFPALLESLF